MSAEPSFRFVHASNLALDRTCFAVGDLPPDLRSDLISAPFLAAERVFDVAVRERVDFVLLAGGLFHCQHCGHAITGERIRRKVSAHHNHWQPGLGIGKERPSDAGLGEAFRRS